MDVFVEEIVRKRKTFSDIIKVLGLVLAATVVALIVFVVVLPMAPQFGSGLFLVVVLGYYGAYWLATSLNLEYEYSLVGHEIDVDKIMNRKKRKRLTTVDIKKIDSFGYKGSKTHEYQKFLADISVKKIYACEDKSAENCFFVVYFEDSVKKMLVFSPTEKIVELIEKMAPKKIV